MNKLLSWCFLVLGLALGQAHAALLQVDSGSGKLVGATGVMMDGISYDVRFLAGSCNSVFDGCDPSLDLFFVTGTSALAASQALLDQVFIGENHGDPSLGGFFDSWPGLTQGCTLAAYDLCMALTPYGFEIGTSLLQSGFATNYGSASLLSDVASLGTTGGGGVETSGIQTFAVWSLSPVNGVPEAPTLALLCAGLLALALHHRSHRREVVSLQ